MVAYGAVVSLLQILDTILLPGGPQISLDKTQLESLHEKVNILLDFLENSSSYRTSKVSARQSLEREIRDAAYKAEDLIEFHISNQLLGEPKTKSFLGKEPETKSSGGISSRFFTVHLYHVGTFLIVIWLLFFIPILMKPLSIQSLMPVNFQNVIFVVTQILITFIVQIVIPLLILSLISAGFTCLMHKAVLKGISFAAHIGLYDSQLEDQVFHQVGISSAVPFCRYDSQLEDQYFRQVVDDISSITEKVIKIKDKYGAGQDPERRNVVPSTSSSRPDSGGTGKNVLVGLDSDLADIKNQLISDLPKIQIVSIVGMGGIGKTTLAREVYDDSYIAYHFYTRAWVTASQEYSLRQVLLGLLETAGICTEKMSEKSEALLAEYLYRSLKGRRYLIVMDDIWDTEIWGAVKRLFPEDSNGSRVLLTTRLSEVALYANSCSHLHRMHFLNQDESWKLLCNKVFGEKDCPKEFEGIGKEIARNCEGLPLAIAVIGGLLSKVSRTTKHWKSVADNLSSVITEDGKHCMEILSLSYNHLPHCLRACFLYMGVFPEDHEIPVQKLIRLWVAEGFLKPSRSKSLEELAEEYLEDLIERNLILVCKRSRNGKIKTCNIHDLLRNLCIQTAKKENFFHVMNCYNVVLQEDANNPRRLSIHPNILKTHFDILCSSHNSSARSLLCTGTRPIHSSHFYLHYRLLRVLDLLIVHFSCFPSEIIKLVHLRYLALACKRALPSSIAKLWNLQTLVHRNWRYRYYPYLPVVIYMMPKLRHLCVTPAYFPDLHVGTLVNNSSLLENLQTLSEVRNFRCGNGILKRIPNLKRLEISYDFSPSGWSAYQLEALVNQHELETLKLLFKDPYSTSEIVNPPKLAFPQKLKRLTLSGCGIPWESMMIVGALEKLEVLKLRRNACRGTEWKPVDGQFCKLKYLLLERINLVKWEANETHFPLLEHLVIRSCYKLKEIPSGIGEIPTLQMIELVGCHFSAVTSAKQIQEEQESMGNEDLKVCVGLGPRFKSKYLSRILHEKMAIKNRFNPDKQRGRVLNFYVFR